ncbi:MAG: DUF1565 domain-containing protein, partial [Planctomycetota bacterium]
MLHIQLALACLLVTVAPAEDIWVDPVLGDNANPGTEAEPLRTIFAASNQHDGIIRLMPGEYSAATGERFPIRLEGQDSIVAEGDSSNTRIVIRDGGSLPNSDGVQVAADCLIKGVTIVQEGTVSTALKQAPAPFTINNSLRLEDSRILGGLHGILGAGNGAMILMDCEIAGQARAAIEIYRGSLTMT